MMDRLLVACPLCAARIAQDALIAITDTPSGLSEQGLRIWRAGSLDWLQRQVEAARSAHADHAPVGV